MKNQNATVLATGIRFGEGPRWHDGRLWFSDMYDHAVKTMDADGTIEVAVVVPGRPSGLGWLPDGRLLIVSMEERQLLRVEDGGLVVHADLSHLAEFHCNDMVVDDVGRAYVGNFGFDLHESERTNDFSTSRLASMVLVEPDGSSRIVATDLAFPNGTVITPDGATLVVAESMGRCLTAFDRAPDGSLSNRRLWADVAPRLPDGICLDAEGAIWIANPFAPECVRIAPGGVVLQVVKTEQPTYACMLGGDDGHTLFILACAQSLPEKCIAEATGTVSITDVEVPGAGLP
jgi:sugar lactone lactonase YvrE